MARATVYYQFDSKAGLLEALFDDLAECGQLAELAAAFTDPDPEAGLRHFVGCFGRFWASDRLVLRRIRAIAALDPDVGPLIASRDERRRHGLQVLIGRLGGAESEDAQGAAGSGRDVDKLVSVIHTLTSFETFDALAGPNQEPDQVIPVVADLVLRVVAGN